MPEMITPALAEVLASRPEVLEQLIGVNEEDEETAEKRFLVLDENNLPKVLKLLFCNVHIRIDNCCEPDGCKKDDCKSMDIHCIRKIVETLGRLEGELQIKRAQLESLQAEADSMREKVLVTEVTLRECEKTLKLLSKEPSCRKLCKRFKLEVKGLQNSLKCDRWLLEEKTQQLECVRYEENAIENNISACIAQLYEQFLCSDKW